jgi:fermentation-respiration switch protein FrsA (DUF1100 family)
MRIVRWVIGIAGAAYLAAIGLLWLYQRELVYTPDSEPYLSPAHFVTLGDVREIRLVTADGLGLMAWYAPAPANRPTVVIFPGQSSSLARERHRIRRFRDAQMGVLLLAWRGYSGNAGEPDEAGLYHDGRAALDWLDARGVAARSLVLYGVSLGTGVATRMAAEREVGAVVLEAPYTSIVAVAAERFPGVPAGWLLRDRFDSLTRIDAVAAPLLIMHGDCDTVIPQALGRRLFAAAAGPKQGFWPHGVGHQDLFDRGGFAAARDFIERAVGAAPGYQSSSAGALAAPAG